MAKISALTLLSAAPADDDEFVILDVSDTTQGAGGSTKGLVASRVARTGAANTFTAAQLINGNLTVNTNTLFVNAANDRVGIGTTAPGVTLDVQRNVTNANPTLRIYNQNAGGGSGLNISGGDNAYNSLLWTDGVTGDLSFQTQSAVFNASNVRMIIQNSGNVGIGTASPSAQLHIDQSSASGAKPTLRLRQAHLTEEFIRFDTTVGAGNPINTTALGAYYGRVRVWVEGVGAKWLALYN